MTKPIKPEAFKEEPRHWYWLMRKTVTEPGEPYPFQPLYGLQRTVSRMLMEGRKIPWVFKEYGVHAEEDIY